MKADNKISLEERLLLLEKPARTVRPSSREIAETVHSLAGATLEQIYCKEIDGLFKCDIWDEIFDCLEDYNIISSIDREKAKKHMTFAEIGELIRIAGKAGDGGWSA